MRIVLSGLQLDWLGGAETYLMTVGTALQRLGHDVVLFAPDHGYAARAAHEQGLEAVAHPPALPLEADAVLANDGAGALELRARYPGAPVALVLHNEDEPVYSPSALPGALHAVVVLNGRLERRVRAAELGGAEIVRLRQPVHIGDLRVDPPERARRVLLFGNYHYPEQTSALRGACARLGLDCEQAGYRWKPVRDSALAMASAEIVVGKARVVVEALAAGRAAYVHDINGASGWVTAERWAELEDDNFGGRVPGGALDEEGLVEDLARWTPQMGAANRELAVRHHHSARHAEALVDLFRRLGTRVSTPPDGLEEMARLVRLEHAARQRALAAEDQVVHLRRELQEAHAAAGSAATEAAAYARSLENALGEKEARLGQLTEEATAAHRGAADLAAAARAEAQRADAAEARLAALLASRRHRAMSAGLAPLDATRRAMQAFRRRPPDQ